LLYARAGYKIIVIVLLCKPIFSLAKGGIIMKKGMVVAAALLVFALSFTQAFATHHTPEERGKAHFNNQAFAGGNKSCSTCHPNGRGLAGAGAKTAFSIMGGEQKSLEEAINACIVNANRGSAIDVNAVEMQELVSYIKSLGAQNAPDGGK
jgi:mono/diheme cytochrome c family protein